MNVLTSSVVNYRQLVPSTVNYRSFHRQLTAVAIRSYIETARTKLH